MAEEKLSTFLVSFQGVELECKTLDDAVAFRAAARLFANENQCDDSPSRIHRVADVLETYGHTAAAERLNKIASRRRAMQFLVGSVGYIPPKHPL